jgi:hypothetical protein
MSSIGVVLIVQSELGTHVGEFGRPETGKVVKPVAADGYGLDLFRNGFIPAICYGDDKRNTGGYPRTSAFCSAGRKWRNLFSHRE